MLQRTFLKKDYLIPAAFLCHNDIPCTRATSISRCRSDTVSNSDSVPFDIGGEDDSVIPAAFFCQTDMAEAIGAADATDTADKVGPHDTADTADTADLGLTSTTPSDSDEVCFVGVEGAEDKGVVTGVFDGVDPIMVGAWSVSLEERGICMLLLLSCHCSFSNFRRASRAPIPIKTPVDVDGLPAMADFCCC